MDDLIEYWQELLAQRQEDLQQEMSIENPDIYLQKLLIDGIEECKEKIKELSNG